MTEDRSDFDRLYWDSSYAVARALIDAHPGVLPDAVGLDQLRHWVIALPGFADDPTQANEHLLNEILREWYEEAYPE